eukprot:CAMPEP_0174955942 /NCGR_PEP_ID=MMETSP0004_2-20121128/1258_1 /TAXON_ID=420556 /ORGANISM="Ochromonas sp., Strain CCMP1393" /LENGTH=46 /DNA_ID= /DNA_START= /DNA_END= /DNA_ORIENTATION=
MATASKYIDKVQQVSEKNSRFSDGWKKMAIRRHGITKYTTPNSDGT